LHALACISDLVVDWLHDWIMSQEDCVWTMGSPSPWQCLYRAGILRVAMLLPCSRFTLFSPPHLSTNFLPFVSS
jgi:hypothetical protein